MNFRPMLIANTLLIMGMAAASTWGWAAIPEAAQLPVHFGLDGTPDRFAGKTEALLIMPLVAVFVTFLMWGVPRLDPRRANIEASAKFWSVSAVLSVALLAYVHGLIVLNATVLKVDVTSALVPALCVLLIGIGNYLGKTRSNFFGGIRTPWTLSSEYAWEKTHRLCGRGFVLSGIVTFGTWLVFDPKIAFATLIAMLTATTIVAFVASYFYWRADPERVAREANTQQQS